MSEKKPPRKHYGLLVRTMLKKDDLAELSRHAKADGRTRSGLVTKILTDFIQQNAEEDGMGNRVNR